MGPYGSDTRKKEQRRRQRRLQAHGARGGVSEAGYRPQKWLPMGVGIPWATAAALEMTEAGVAMQGVASGAGDGAAWGRNRHEHELRLGVDGVGEAGGWLEW